VELWDLYPDEPVLMVCEFAVAVRAREGDLLDVNAPRGSFTLCPRQNPVVLLSAGVGATPVMSVPHTLAAERSQREIWWIYRTRNRVDHPFAEESRSLLKQLSGGRRHIVYSRPAATDQIGGLRCSGAH
jgi:ferredoxin-NADP reductase